MVFGKVCGVVGGIVRDLGSGCFLVLVRILSLLISTSPISVPAFYGSLYPYLCFVLLKYCYLDFSTCA